MFKENNLEKVANVLIKRKAYIYHACHLQDFYTYLKLGGITSRNVMASSHSPFTAFKSDKEDKVKKVWTHVFGNFSDFSSSYHNGKRAIPNPYGPILIKIDPNVIKESEALFVSLRSVSAKKFSIKDEYLKTKKEFLNVFYDNDEKSKSSSLCFDKEKLKERFPDKIIRSPEWSLRIEGEKIPTEWFLSITVDPITVNGITLFDEIRRLAKNYHPILGKMVERRKCNVDYHELIKEIKSGATKLEQVKGNKILSKWAGSVEELDLDWLFGRFAEYISNGTIDRVGELMPLEAS